MAYHLSIFIDVSLFSKIEDAVCFLTDCKVVLGYLYNLAVMGFFLYDNSGLDSINYLSYVCHGNC